MIPSLDFSALRQSHWYQFVVRFLLGGAVTLCTKKKKAGINCRARGRKAAALDAAGAVLGGWGMLCFALTVWLALGRYAPALVLALAGTLWLIVSASLWWARRHLA